MSTYAMDVRILSSRQEACSLSTAQRVEVVVNTVGVCVISVSLCKQEMTVKDGIISWSVMNDVTVGNNEKDRKRGNERFAMCATSICWRYESKVVTRIFSRVKNVQKSINTRASYVFYTYTDTALCFIWLVLLTVWLLCYLQWANLKRLFATSGKVVFTKPNDFDERISR